MAEVRLDTSAVQRMLSNLGSNLPKVVSRALNKTISSARTEMKRQIAKDIGIKAGVVDKSLKVTKASTTSFVARLNASGKRIPLINLITGKPPEPSRGKGRGVSYRLGGKTRRIPSAFVATMPRSGHRGVFRRVGKEQIPIIELFGPSIVHVFGKKLPAVQKRAGEQFETEVDRAVQSLLK
jgi:hypothetical protein